MSDAVAIGQKAVMPDSNKAPGQAVQQKASDKLHRTDGN